MLGPGGQGYLSGVVAIAAGGNHSLALQAGGSAWTWGHNSHGQLGDASTAGRSTPTRATNLPPASFQAGGARHSLASLAGTSPGSVSYSYDAAHRLTSAGLASYGYDGNGHQTSRGADSFSWDFENRLTAATVSGASATYSYRPDGLRHSKTADSHAMRTTCRIPSCWLGGVSGKFLSLPAAAQR